MAIIYGSSGAEKELLKNCYSDIPSFKEIKPYLENLKEDLFKKTDDFTQFLPKRKRNQKKEIKKLERIFDKTNLKLKEDNKEIFKKIKKNKEQVKTYHKLILNYFTLFYKNKIKNPKLLKKIENEIVEKKNFLETIENNSEGLFYFENEALITQIEHLENLIKTKDYHGAKGEIEVLQKLEKLPNTYYILCDISIELNEYIFHRNKKNLKSAQIDFVVVGPSGIYAIEVKNWSKETLSNNYEFTPYEQVEREGKILFIYLNEKFYFYKPKVSNLLISTNSNIRYNSNFKSVLVKYPNNIVQFIENNTYNYLEESKIMKIVRLLSK